MVKPSVRKWRIIVYKAPKFNQFGPRTRGMNSCCIQLLTSRNRKSQPVRMLNWKHAVLNRTPLDYHFKITFASCNLHSPVGMGQVISSAVHITLMVLTVLLIIQGVVHTYDINSTQFVPCVGFIFGVVFLVCVLSTAWNGCGGCGSGNGNPKRGAVGGNPSKENTKVFR